MLKKILLPLFISLLIASVNSFAQNPKSSATSKTSTQVKTPEKPDKNDKVVPGKKGPDGQAVYEGAKGGMYYINKNGNKTYLKDEDKVVPNKKGPDGQKVYAGPQGGEYYINKSGNKVYLKNAGK